MHHKDAQLRAQTTNYSCLEKLADFIKNLDAEVRDKGKHVHILAKFK